MVQVTCNEALFRIALALIISEQAYLTKEGHQALVERWALSGMCLAQGRDLDASVDNSWDPISPNSEFPDNIPSLICMRPSCGRPIVSTTTCVD